MFYSKEIYNKIKEESKAEVKKLELDLVVQREMSKQMEEKISKIYEEYKRGEVKDVKSYYELNPPKGEIVIVIQGKTN